MSKIAVVYWSRTGNTKAMAAAIADGAKSKGAEVSLMTAAEFGADRVSAFDAIAFGCPAMGTETLEAHEFEPMFASCESKLGGKRIALFGSHGRGDGTWMRSWEDSCRSDGAILVHESVICRGAPDKDTLARCKALGDALV